MLLIQEHLAFSVAPASGTDKRKACAEGSPVPAAERRVWGGKRYLHFWYLVHIHANDEQAVYTRTNKYVSSYITL
jgi:hypothetical protein